MYVYRSKYKSITLAQFRANRSHKPTQTIGVKIMKTVNLQKFKESVARSTESTIVRVLADNAKLLWSIIGVKSDADHRQLRSICVARLAKLRSISADKAELTAVQVRLNRAVLLNKADKVLRKSVATLVAQAQEGVLVTPAMIMEVEAKLGFQLSEGALKAIFFAYVNKGVAMFDLAIQFAESISSDFVMSVFKTIRFMERTAVRAVMIAKGLLSTGKVAVSKALAVAFAIAKSA